MREVGKIKEEVKLGLPDSQDWLRFFNHSRNRERMKDNPKIVIWALGCFLQSCRSQAEMDYYTSTLKPCKK